MFSPKFLSILLILLFCSLINAQKPYDGPIPTLVQKDKKWIYRDKGGDRVIKDEYDEAWFFNDGLAVVKQFGFTSISTLKVKLLLMLIMRRRVTSARGSRRLNSPKPALFISIRKGKG
ncbi:hypothetical protein MASR1M107_30110 [Ignavibacteriales bacterium]